MWFQGRKLVIRVMPRRGDDPPHFSGFLSFFDFRLLHYIIYFPMYFSKRLTPFNICFIICKRSQAFRETSRNSSFRHFNVFWEKIKFCRLNKLTSFKSASWQSWGKWKTFKSINQENYSIRSIPAEKFFGLTKMCVLISLNFFLTF